MTEAARRIIVTSVIVHLLRNEVIIMPPKVRYPQEAIVEAGFEIARESGMDAVNARAVAAKLGCSTQPLFREFQSMEQIKEAVGKRAFAFYQQFAMRAMMGAEKPFKAAGMAYLRFAREETHLFQALFMCDRGKDAGKRSTGDAVTDYSIDVLMANTGLSRENARLVQLYLWLFVHGMASMIATNSATFTKEEMDGLVAGAYHAVLGLFQPQGK